MSYLCRSTNFGSRGPVRALAVAGEAATGGNGWRRRAATGDGWRRRATTGDRRRPATKTLVTRLLLRPLIYAVYHLWRSHSPSLGTYSFMSPTVTVVCPDMSFDGFIYNIANFGLFLLETCDNIAI